MVSLEAIQNLVTCLYVIKVRIACCFQKVKNMMSSSMYTPTPKHFSNKELAYQTQIIISNIQMTWVLISVCLLGFSIGYIQGAYDPSSCPHIWNQMEMFGKEIALANEVGCILGMVIAVGLELLRQAEVKHKRPMKDSAQMSSQDLNFDDTEEERISLINMKPERGRNPDNLMLQSDSDDEDLSSFVKLKNI